MFKKGDVYFLITSGATGWNPNQVKYATASSIEGTWSNTINFGDGTTYDSQSAYVIPVEGAHRQLHTCIWATDGRVRGAVLCRILNMYGCHYVFQQRLH